MLVKSCTEKVENDPNNDSNLADEGMLRLFRGSKEWWGEKKKVLK